MSGRFFVATVARRTGRAEPEKEGLAGQEGNVVQSKSWWDPSVSVFVLSGPGVTCCPSRLGQANEWLASAASGAPS